ncbi:MAG: hypothetical protein MHPSP_004078, partial [Paramarteilia canceri]
IYTLLVVTPLLNMAVYSSFERYIVCNNNMRIISGKIFKIIFIETSYGCEDLSFDKKYELDNLKELDFYYFKYLLIYMLII